MAVMCTITMSSVATVKHVKTLALMNISSCYGKV